MKNEIITKVNKIGKAGEIISNIAKAILIIGTIFCLVGGLLLAIMPEDMVVLHMGGNVAVEVNTAGIAGMGMNNEHGQSVVLVGTSGALEVNGLEYGVTNTTATDNGFLIEAEADSYSIRLSQLASTVFLGAATCVVMWITMHFVSKLCKLFKECETPFTEEIVQALKKLAIALIPMAFITNLATSVTDSIMTGNVNIVIGVDVTTILLVLLVFMLSAIFSYGAMLQQESDETL